MAILAQKKLFGWQEIEAESEQSRLKSVLEILPDEALMASLERQRKGRRDDYPIRAVWNSIIAGIIYQHPSIESLRQELKRNGELRDVCGFNLFKGSDAIPPAYIYTRFLKKLIAEKSYIEKMFNDLIGQIKDYLPELGKYLAVDGKAIQSYSKGKSDPDGDWGKKVYKGVDKDGRSWEKVTKWFGYKLHLIVDADYELPLAYKLSKASVNDSPHLLPMMDDLQKDQAEIVAAAEYACADKGYDSTDNNTNLYDRFGIKPIIDIRNHWEAGETKPIDASKADNVVYDYKGNVYCMTGWDDSFEKSFTKMNFAGFEKDRKTLKYKCPAQMLGLPCKNKDKCQVGRIVRIKLDTDRRVFTPVARSSYKFSAIYKKRTSVERVFSRMDNLYGFEKHYIRGMEKMKVRVGLSLMVMLAMALSRIKKNEKKNICSLVMPLAA